MSKHYLRGRWTFPIDQIDRTDEQLATANAIAGSTVMLRVVHDVDGMDWTVIPIREGWRWDPEIEMRRRDWLCCVTTGERRYISPVPPGWEQWTDAELGAAIRHARPDLRGPR